MAVSAAVSVKYNDIPSKSKVLTRIKQLGKDEFVQYRLHGAYDPNQPTKFFGRTVRIPPKDIIIDPDTGDTYDIAIVKSIGAGGIPQFDSEVYFDAEQGCLLTLRGNNAREMRMYKYFEMCNFNGDNPYRDSSKPLLFERVDEVKDHEVKRNTFRKKVAAMEALEQFSEEDVLNFIRANRLPDLGSFQKNLAALEDIAQSDPDKFLSLPLLDHTSLYKLIEEAHKKKVITFNNTTKEYSTFDNRKLYAVKKTIGVSVKDELAKHLMSPDGQKDLEWIKLQLSQ